MCPSIEISTAPERLDVPMIHAFLTQSYWAKGRSLEEVRTAIESSLNYGLYVEGKQVAYARVLTDYIAFAYILDVFVLPEYRGKGYATRLLKEILNNPEIKVHKWMLATRDAHDVYKKLGFDAIKHPERLMEQNP